MAEYTVIVIRCEVGDCTAGLRYEWATKRSATLAARQLGWFVKSRVKTRCPRCKEADPPRVTATVPARFDPDTDRIIAHLYMVGEISTYALAPMFNSTQATIARAVIRGGGKIPSQRGEPLAVFFAVVVVVCAAAFLGSVVIDRVVLPLNDLINRKIWHWLGGTGNPPEDW